MDTNYTNQDRGNTQSYRQYLEAMDAVSVEKVASASSFFDPKEGNTIVDVGMASGTSTAILAQLFPQLNIIGVDINPKMVEIAQDTYQLPNLSFRIDDGEKLTSFENSSVDGFFNCSAIHHITSFNNYDSNRALNTLQRQADLLKDRGVLVVRDFVKPEQQEVIIELSTLDKSDRPNDCDLLLQFATQARSLANPHEQGFPVEEIKSVNKNTRRFRLFYTDAVEYIRRKDYYSNWDIELQEEYGYFTQAEFEECFHNLGLRIILSAPIYNQWIINNRYKNQLRLFDLQGNEIGFPPTNYLIAGEKVKGGKQIQPVRYLPHTSEPFLKYSAYTSKTSKKIYDVVERPNEVIDIIPYYTDNDKLKILAKHGYPRPLANVRTDSAILDGKYLSGYISEGITMAVTDDLKKMLDKRFGIAAENYTEPVNALNYFTSPGGINERVQSVYVELTEKPEQSAVLESGFSGFSESGYIHVYDAAQLLNTAQTGALVEARLELNIYNLFFKNELSLPKWLGEDINVKFHSEMPVTDLSGLLSVKMKDYVPSDKTADFLRTERVCFAESGVDGSSSILEYVYPQNLSSNTLLTVPLFRNKEKIYIGLEVRNLPVPQIHSGNSTILTLPAERLPKDVNTLYGLNRHITQMRVGKAKVESYFKLGEKYCPSIGVTTEQVYPYVVCLSSATRQLQWVCIDELYGAFDKLNDAHLLICLARLKHALGNNIIPV